MRTHFITTLVSCLFGILWPVCTFAGGPENVVLVVNAESPSSLLIANHYLAGRNIPAQHVIYLSGVPDEETINLDPFRDKILKPVLAEIQARGLANCTDYIVYSADFPTAVRIGSHRRALLQSIAELNQPINPKLFNPTASINSLTFFAAAVLNDQPGYLMLNSNHYYRQPTTLLLRRPFLGEVQRQYQQAVDQLDQDDPEQWKQVQQTLESMVADNPRQLALAYQLARCFGKQGDARKSAQWLTRAVQLGWQYAKQTQADQAFDPVKDDPLFAGLLQQMRDVPFEFIPPRGFRNRYAWAPNGMVNQQPGQGNRHFLSTVLAVTRNQGNTEREAVEQLARTMRADGSQPAGKFYFTQTRDVRSQTRQPEFESAIAELKRLGYSSEIVTSKLPTHADDVLGVTCGTASFDWMLSANRFQPGAIGDNLTSFGGRMAVRGQTKLTEFLAHGAAGASGTVVEPYALGAKFPQPMIHATYASGCTLGEAFYQSVHGPFQLLIVGDPLCRPFAQLPQLTVRGVEPWQSVKSSFTLELDDAQSPDPIQSVQLYVDGRLVHWQPGLAPLQVEINQLTDGYHDFRVVGLSQGLLEITHSVELPLMINQHGHEVELKVDQLRYGVEETLELEVRANFGDQVGLMQNGRMLAKQAGREATFEIPASGLGRGPVTLEAVALETSSEQSGDSATSLVSSRPVDVFVEGRLSEFRQQTESPEK